MSFHKNLIDDDIHAMPAKTYANISARDADTAFQVTENLNKMVRIDSPLSYYILSGVGPAIWVEFSSTVNNEFLENLDTPNSFSGQAGFVLQVNASEMAVEFGQALRTTDSPQFADLTVLTDGDLGFGTQFFTQDSVLGPILQLTDPEFTIVYNGKASLNQKGTSSALGILSDNEISGEDVIGNPRGYGALVTSIEDNTAGNFTGSIRLSVAHQGNSILQSILGVNINQQKEVFIYDNLRFNNLSTGADPVLTANAADQTLTLDGDFNLGTNAIKFIDGSKIDSTSDIFQLFSEDSFSFRTSQTTFFTVQLHSARNTVGTMGHLDFVAKDTGGTDTIYASLDAVIVDPANGVETGAVRIGVTRDGVKDVAVVGFNELDRLETLIYHDLQIKNQLAGGDPILSSSNPTRSELGLAGDLTISGFSPILKIQSLGDFQQANVDLMGSRDPGGITLVRIGAFNSRSGADVNVASIEFLPGAVGTSSGAIAFVVKSESGSLDEAVRITEFGNVGIGTTAPTAKLEVGGQVKITGGLTKSLTGTVSVTIGTPDVTGAGTLFTSELEVGSAIKISGDIFTVASITSDTVLTLDSNHIAGATSVTANTDSPLLQIFTGDQKTALLLSPSGNLTLPGVIIGGSDVSSNTLLGDGALDSLTDGASNTGLGFNAGALITTGDNNLCVGKDADTSTPGASNEIVIGNSSNTKTLLRGAVRGNTFDGLRLATAVSATTAGQSIIAVTSTAAARTITLATLDTVDGREIIIKDESGAAGTNNITIDTEGSEIIDGVATKVISANYGSVRVYSDGTNWFII